MDDTSIIDIEDENEVIQPATAREDANLFIRTTMANDIELIRHNHTIGVDVTKFEALFHKKAQEAQKTFGTSPLSPQESYSLRRSILIEFMGASRDVPKRDLIQQPSISPESAPTLIMIDPHENGGSLTTRIDKRIKWESLKDSFTHSGAKVEHVNGAKTLGSQTEVFTRDHYVLIGNTAYLPDIYTLKRYKQDTWRAISDSEIESRGKAIEDVTDILKRRGITTITVKDSWFEGGNVLTDEPSKTIFMGIGRDSDPSWLSRFISTVNMTQPQQYELLGVPLSKHRVEDGNLYHLDLGMSEPLANGHRLIYPGMTDPDTYAKIKGILGHNTLIEISFDDAKNFATNFEKVGHNIVMTRSIPTLTNLLTEQGYNVLTPNQVGLDEYNFSAGGVHCMTNRIIPSVDSFLKR